MPEKIGIRIYAKLVSISEHITPTKISFFINYYDPEPRIVSKSPDLRFAKIRQNPH